jgi:long-chain fatty acid transport protein
LTGLFTSYKLSSNGSSTGALSGSGGDAGGVGVVPNGYLSWALNKDLYVGVGFGAPFGLKTDYDNPWLGGAQAIKFDIKTYNINPSIAYRVNNMVSLGFGVDWQRMEAEYVRIAGINPAPIAGVVPVPLNTTTVKLKADDDSWGWNAGVLLNLSPSTKVGVSYRSSVKHKLDGSLTASGPAALAAFHASQSGPATADIELPETLIISASQAINDQWEMLGDISWTGWSSIDKVDVVRANGTVAQTLDTKFRDTWRVALGANYKLSDAWKLKFGTAYDQTPIRDAEHRLVSLPDNNRVWLSTGAQWKPNKASAVDFGITYLYVKDPEINNNQSSNLRGLVKGTYSDSVWILGAQYSTSF